MTIRKRLVISNVLMIAIPAVISMVVLAIAFMIAYMAFNDAIREWIQAERAMEAELAAATYEGLLVGVTAVFSVGLIILTNHFLSKFVFDKIKKPLQILSDGVHEISAGNLGYRIAYDEEDEFRQICEDFNGMAEHLRVSIEEVQKNERNRKALLIGISHDLRSPLTSIKAFVEGLQDGVAATPEAQREYLSIIRQKTDDIISMVSQLFLYSKMDMGAFPISPERIDIGGELAEFAAASREEYRALGLRVETGDLPDGLFIFADPVLLRSVFTNILTNSAKYKDKDEGTAMIRCGAEDGTIRVVFEDDGPGVPEGELPRIFEAFYRGDPSRSNPHQGSGLGLAIAQRVVERMDGRISAQNRAGGGLRIVIDIPEMKGALA